MVVTAIKSKRLHKYTFRRGVHPPHRKLTEQMAVVPVWPVAGKVVVIPMSQHIGAPCEPTVEAKQQVSAGDVVGTSKAFVSAPVHSSVNGIVESVGLQPHPGGRKVMGVVITVGPEQRPPLEWRKFPKYNIDDYERDSIGQAVRQAGVVGMGGAAFPTAVKLVWNPKSPVDTVLINGCECEPYLTTDHRLMAEAPEPIVAGARLAMKAVGAKRCIIAIEDNKPDAIEAIRAEIGDIADIQLAICMTKYPQGGERQLIKAVLGREVPSGGLPSEVRAVVVNVATASAIAWACVKQRPVTERIVTLTGGAIEKPGNYLVPVGMMLSDLIEQCGGLTDDVAKVLLGGPMMGATASNLDVPILKGTSGITVMSKDEVAETNPTACIRCGRCVDHCPLGLVPTRLAHAVKVRDLDTAAKYDLQACCECGCCTYVCPSQIPLLQYLRSGKTMLRLAQDAAARKE